MAAGRAARVCSGGSTVPAAVVIRYQRQGRSGGSTMPATGSYSVGKSARNLVGRSQAYRRDQYRNSRHSGAISLSMVCGSAVPAQGRFRRQIGTESCRFRLICISAQGLSGAGAVCTGAKEEVVVIFRVRQGPNSVLAKTLF